MAILVKGASGSKIDSTPRGAMLTLSVIESVQAFLTIQLGRAWSVTGNVTTGASSFFLHIQNDEPRDVVITRIATYGSAANTLRVQSVIGTPTGGTIVTPANRVIGSERAPSPGIVSQVASALGGLTTVNSYEFLTLGAQGSGSGGSEVELLARPLVLTPTHALAVFADNATTFEFALDFVESVVESE